MINEEIKINENTKLTPQQGIHVAIEGNIGAGKTTLAHQLVNYCDQYDSVKFKLFEEPVSEWKSFGQQQTNLLKLLYENPTKYSFDFQVSVLLTKCEQLHNYTKSTKTNILVERTIESQTMVFVPHLKLNNYLTDCQYEILIRLMNFQIKMNNLKPDLYIYLRTTPSIAKKRIQERGRIEEKDINIEYLQQLHDKYEEWFKNPSENIMIIDGDKPIEMHSLFEAIRNWVEKINV
jgi:deoxyadenosine/deoxycytidine kinase